MGIPSKSRTAFTSKDNFFLLTLLAVTLIHALAHIFVCTRTEWTFSDCALSLLYPNSGRVMGKANHQFGLSVLFASIGWICSAFLFKRCFTLHGEAHEAAKKGHDKLTVEVDIEANVPLLEADEDQHHSTESSEHSNYGRKSHHHGKKSRKSHSVHPSRKSHGGHANRKSTHHQHHRKSHH